MFQYFQSEPARKFHLFWKVSKIFKNCGTLLLYPKTILYFFRFADLITYKISRATLKKGKYKLYIDCQRFSNSTASSPDVDCCNQSRIFDIDIDHQFDLVDVAILIGLILIIGSSTFAITVLYLRRRVLEPSTVFVLVWLRIQFSILFLLQLQVILKCCSFSMQ